MLGLLAAALAPHESGLYSNFTDAAVGVSGFFPDETSRRLQAVKAHWDPDNDFKANHAIASGA